MPIIMIIIFGVHVQEMEVLWLHMIENYIYMVVLVQYNKKIYVLP